MSIQSDQNDDQYDMQNDSNSLIAYNLHLLTSHSVNNYNILQNENVKLGREIRFLKDDLEYIKKRKREDENKIQQLEKVIEKNDKHKKPKITKSDYVIRKYRKNKDSYDEGLLKRTIQNIKTIKDIINLENKWRSIRHHTQLQKLHLLILFVVNIMFVWAYRKQA